MVEPDSESPEDSSDDASKRKKKQARVSDMTSSEDEDDRRRRKNPQDMKRSSSSFQFEAFGISESTNVYRAIKEEQSSLTWSEAPCSLCPSFDFCKDGGPVNPIDCVYYGGWLAKDSLSTVEG